MQELVGSCTSSSKKLIEYLQTWQKRPSLDADLGGTLDSYVTQLNGTQDYVSHGYSGINFAEAAIFIQNWAAVYDKKVDLLLKTFIQLHSALCDISSKEPEEAVLNADVSNKQKTEQQNEQPKEKSKKRKKDKNENQSDPANVQTEEAAAVEITAAVDGAVPFGDKELQDSYSEKELQEIGVLWNMLNNMERKKIENILNKIDEETDQTNNKESTTVELNNTTVVDISVHIPSVESESTAIEAATSINEVTNTTKDINATPIIVQEDMPPADNNETVECAFDDHEDMFADAPCEEETQEVVADEEINKIEENVISANLEAKVACLRQVRVRLECLSDGVLDVARNKSQPVVQKTPKPQDDGVSCVNEKQVACRDCKGCRALRDISSIKKKFDLTTFKKKDLVIQQSDRDIFRRRKRSLESNKENELRKNVSHKKIKLPPLLTVSHKTFESFYHRCYSGLKWKGKKLTVCIESEIINENDFDSESMDVDISSTQNKLQNIDENKNNPNIEDENLIEDALKENNILMDTETNENSNEDDDNDSTDLLAQEEDITQTNEASETIDASQNINTSATINTSDNIDASDNIDVSETINSSDNIDASATINASESIDVTGSVDSSQQLTSSEPSDECIGASILSEEVEKSSAGPIENELSQTYFCPNTPAHSEDSGRFSAAAYHSDTEMESQLNRAVHSDSGVEMSHHSEDEDDVSSVILSNPFKDLAPPAISFYKKKCESLLEQRERDQKVQEWEEFLKEKSKTSEMLPTFNISEYENKILNKFPDESLEEIPFSSFVSGKTVEEISRFFLASLQLANMENIQLSDEKCGHVSKDGLKLRCISKRRYYEDTSHFSTFSEENFMESLSNMQSRSAFMQSTPSTSSVKFKRKHSSR